jgi:type VI secretion system protein ImpE
LSASELFRTGKLKEAIAAALEEVRSQPNDAGRRLFLAELLCFGGELERADNHLDAVAGADPQSMPWILTFRQLVRAEQARQDFFSHGRLPEFLTKPEGAIADLLAASTRVRDGSLHEAGMLLEQADQARPRSSGTCDGQKFDDIRDLDDQTSGVFEVLTSNGTYYWIPIHRVESIEFSEPTRARDLIWRRTHMIVSDGPDGEVYVPALYPGAGADPDDLIRLGRRTDWRGGDGSPVRGAGQRTFLVGEEARSILELKSITFENPSQS